MQRCFQQFVVYIWAKCKPYKILFFLNEMKEYIDFNGNSSWIFGLELCQKNNYFFFYKLKMVVFHNCLIDFFDKVLGMHVGNTVLVDHNLVRTMKNPIENVMSVEKSNGRVDISLKYLMGEVLP